MVVAVSGLFSCELFITSSFEWLQGCCAELQMCCSEMLESWEEQSASCDESAQRDPKRKNKNKKTFKAWGQA